MARRSDHTRETLKNMMVDAGGRLMAAEGLQQFSARKVARAVGYTVGTVYNVFGSHDDLILAINAVTLDDLYVRLAATQQDSAHDGQKALRQLAQVYLAFAAAEPHRWEALFSHSLPPETPLPDWYAAKIRQLFALVEAPLLTLGPNPAAARRAAETIWASLHGICLLGHSGKLAIVEAAPMPVLVEELLTRYLDGLSLG